MSLCYPPQTDWSCAYDETELAEMWSNPQKSAVMRRSEAMAWYTLAALTAYRIGVCPTIVRPCAIGCVPPGSWLAAPVGGEGQFPLRTIGRSFTPHMEGGVWVNSCGCSSADSCSCRAMSEVLLPGPVGDIVEVKIDGVILDPLAYRVDNGNRLVRQDGQVWPSCQDMNAREGAEGTFTVEYYRGAAPNEITRFAAGILAVEFYKGCVESKCRLPKDTVAVARQGVTIELAADQMESIASWREIGPVIAMFNPNRLKAAPRVLSPDTHVRTRRQTWGYR